MIQRIQSVLLLLATISLIVAMFMPVAIVTTNEVQYLFTPWTLQENIPGGNIVYTTYYIGILQVIVATMSFIAIFLYKKRPLQSKLCVATVVVNFILLLLMLYVYPDRLLGKNNDTVFSLWTLASILPLALIYTANKFILKDEKKVREADRLR